MNLEEGEGQVIGFKQWIQTIQPGDEAEFKLEEKELEGEEVMRNKKSLIRVHLQSWV